MLIVGGYLWQLNEKSNPPTSTAQSLAAPKPWKASAAPRRTPANMDSHPQPSPPTPNRLTLSSRPSPYTWPSSVRPHPGNLSPSIKRPPRKLASDTPGPLKRRPGTVPSPRSPVCQTNRSVGIRFRQMNRIDPRPAIRFCQTNPKCQPQIRHPTPILRNEPNPRLSLGPLLASLLFPDPAGPTAPH